EAYPPVAWFHVTAFDAQILRRIRNVRFARRNPVTDDSRPNHVRYKLIMFAVPNPHDRARTAASVDLTNDVAAARRKSNLILHDAGRPKDPDDVRFFRLVDAGNNFHRILPEISRR